MNETLRPILILSLIGVGVLTGRWLARLPKPFWFLGYFVPLGLICLLGLEKNYPHLNFVWPFSLLGPSMVKLHLLAMVTPILLITSLWRSANRRLRVLGTLFLFSFLVQYCILPVLVPLVIRNQMARLDTVIDSDGICLQRTEFTCGPAAAVTALRRLHLTATEGELAVLARTTRFAGTPPDVLAETLQSRYGKEGLQSEYRSFHSLEELRSAGLTLAVIKFNFWLDHYVTVLEVTDKQVVVGDPLEGKVRYTRAAFEKVWRHSGVVLKRETAASRL